MDPLSLSASIVGFISLVIEVTKILGVFIGCQVCFSRSN
ncbi:Protein of unknown function [Pyronema omphalodes CBS 100304]|uniref:Uncharacterized protein n=1 Tax=Pyronema omphalodes (strain CBS 100304) TaxID=1076935 RepID=U4LCK1_PYROM|nr:Protein of unknown function [Pyronema omphalodes CBS 100304]